MENSNIIDFREWKPKKQVFDFETIEIIQQAIFVLKNAVGGIKLTVKGNLPRKLTQQFWTRFLTGGKLQFLPHQEEACRELHRLNFLLSESKYFEKSKGKLILSSKGEAIYQAKDWGTLYEDLFITMTNSYNWGFDDRYGMYGGRDFEEIQESVWELLSWLIEQKPAAISPVVLMREIFNYQTPTLQNDDPTGFLAEEPTRCLQTRFFERFCVPFGLMNRPTVERDDFFHDFEAEYSLTPFLINHIRIDCVPPFIGN